MSSPCADSSKAALLFCTDAHLDQRTNLNDRTDPHQAFASPKLSTASGSIGANFGTVRSSSASHIFRAFALPAADCRSCPSTSAAVFAPTNFTTETISSPIPPLSPHTPLPPIPASSKKADPIPIPPPTLTARDINRVPTPLSARGNRRGHLFPFSHSPSPRLCSLPADGKARKTSSADSEEFFGHLERVLTDSPASSMSGRSHRVSWNMHNESMSFGRYPTSPLSPKLPSKPALSPQNSQRRGNHGRQPSRTTPATLGRFHPSNFPQTDALTAASSAMQAPQITYTRAPPPMQIESPRLLRDKHREFLEKARLSSKLAASPLAIKPEAPRLDPLGSPKGPVTPLALEEAQDYFTIAHAGRISPAASPGSRSPRARSVSSDDETKHVGKPRHVVLA